MLGLLIEIYQEDGPRETFRGRSRVVPPEKFAAMSSEKIDKTWDFDRRHLMHKVAMAIVAASPR